MEDAGYVLILLLVLLLSVEAGDVLSVSGLKAPFLSIVSCEDALHLSHGSH